MGYLHKNIQFQKSIYFKIMLLGIAVVAIFGVFLMTTYQMSTEQLEKEITSNAEALSQQLRQNISSRLNVMENNGFLSVDLSKNFSDNLDVLNNSGDTSERLKARFEIGKVLENWPYNQHQILWTAVLDNNGNVYARGCEKLPSRKKLTEIFERADYDRCYSVPGKTMWLSDGNGGIILIRAIFHMDKLEFCGYVMADLKIDDIEELFLSNDLKEVGYYILYDKNEEPIYISDNQLEALAKSYQNGSFQLDGWEKQYVMSEYTLFQDTLKLVSVVDLQKKHERFREVMETLLLLGLGVVSLSGFCIIMIFLGTAKKLQVLLNDIDRVAAGDFSSVCGITSQDELGMIAFHINYMSSRIQELMKKTAESEKQRQEAHYQMLQFQYHVLQAQVNPHFLFNTLQSVHALALLNGDSEVSSMVMKLARLYRSNIERTEVFCTLQDELNYIDNYLQLNQEIYQGRLKVEYDLDEQLGSMMVPTFVLQPLVENSLVHGMENKIGICTIRIRTFRERDNLYITIWDDGAGISPERLREIRERSLSEKRIGIWNVNKRIHLLYGKEYGLHIRSEYSVYTEVLVNLPCREKGEWKDGDENGYGCYH